jgi:predicted ATPase
MRKSFLFFIIVVSIFANDFEKSLNIVTDKTTNIMWQDNLESTQYLENITMAKTYCENLILNGYIDWKMATIKQLQTILDITNKNTTIKKEFQYTTQSKYWSKSNYIVNKNQFWYIDFKTGIVNFSTRDNQYTVRCIREFK